MSISNDKESIFSYSVLLGCLKSAFFLTGAVIALFVWFIDPFIDAFFLQEGTFYQQLTQPEPLEIYMRSIVSVLIIIFSFFGSVLLTHSRQAAEALLLSEKKKQ